MGICISKGNVYPSTQEEKETNIMINKQLQEEAKIKEKNDNSTYKVLLLGIQLYTYDFIYYFKKNL